MNCKHCNQPIEIPRQELKLSSCFSCAETHTEKKAMFFVEDEDGNYQTDIASKKAKPEPPLKEPIKVIKGSIERGTTKSVYS